MSALADRWAGVAAHGLDSMIFITERELKEHMPYLVKRINITTNNTTPLPLFNAVNKQDPWRKSGKYALGWVYFSIVLLVFSIFFRLYNLWTDLVRRDLHKELNREKAYAATANSWSPAQGYELDSVRTENTTQKFFPPATAAVDLPENRKTQSSLSSIALVNGLIALVRWIFYRPMPVIRIWKIQMVLPSLGVIFVVSAAFIFVTLYTFIPQPYYYQTIRFGSPPLAIRSGMIAVAMMPWIIATSMKANLISLLTGIGHERLNVLHRWGGYICLFLSLIHMIPFYVQPVWKDNGMLIFRPLFSNGVIVYGTGIASIVPLMFLCVHSLPILRSWMYELFVIIHIPASIVFLAMLFWHCHNFLTSWNYLWATVAIWLSSYLLRLFFLNWTNPFRRSILIGEESAITILPENAVKITIPTQTRWRPGQYVYIRMPGIALLGNHPFTIASLCSDDFPSDYGDNYRDMALVFRPFGGFTRQVLETAVRNGPYQTYQAFLDGPYGGMRRRLESFDNVVLIAGGSGVTAIVSHLLHLIKLMRDGKAATRRIEVVWAIKRTETMKWFREELKICRDFAPPDAVRFQFFVTAAQRQGGELSANSAFSPTTPNRPTSFLSERLNLALQGVQSKRNSAYIREEAGGDADREQQLRAENEDAIAALPQAHLAPATGGLSSRRQQAPPGPLHLPAQEDPPNPQLDFGFPSTPTMLEKNLMRLAFLPDPGIANASRRRAWASQYGRPDLPYMLRGFSEEFGRRNCVFVCGPPGMRVDVANAVARLQTMVWDRHRGVDEVFLHAENYAL
ncbi:MAG: hypothetical protein M1819_004206 [Sarea resinae]|nr:MAG: hypothetical protein M1819_004206 [Sarea resinae]